MDVKREQEFEQKSIAYHLKRTLFFNCILTEYPLFFPPNHLALGFKEGWRTTPATFTVTEYNLS